ncbi:HlyD family secretion protein, partial [Zeaxanthinibacter enoshimensis]|uniref:HlyD family secretion protein n=1 Tax=Zeaxanthinibacter enoshimensis TaxID=392009 RepID=UPI00356B439F
LAEKGVISDHDYQNHLNELRKKRFEYVQFRSRQREIWIQERFTWQQEIDRIQAEIESMKGELKDLVILSPLTGHLLSSQLSQPGTVLYNGSLLAEISPDTSRLVECFINSSLIGFLKENARVRFSIDAYNHNLWGMADGRIRDIGKDVELIDKYPYYRVLCSLDTEFLQLKNGVKGQIKKGMSLSAHFLLAERSLYDLLFDSMDDWLDPSNL